MRQIADTDITALVAGIQWWQVLVAIIIVVVGWVLAHFARRGVLAVFARGPEFAHVYAAPVARITQYVILALAVGLGLVALGANVQPLLAVVIIVGVVAVLVLRGTADNFAASVLIQSRHPVRVGDEIQVDAPDGAITGTVTELNTRSVILVTADGRTVHVPNAKLLGDSVVNHSTHRARRSEVQVRVSRGAGESLDTVLDALARAVAAVDGVHAHEAVRALPTGVSPERVIAVVQFWHHPAHGVTVSADVVRALAADFADRGVSAAVTSSPGAAPLTPPAPF
ncbi:mechanosensitive ion channel family protein [Microbacterium jejuense]|uniref:Mechanosensitive ion channel family protein n=1 Tax=Microbacterium jejuense TaxID=1263637 RepID=A0ABS7HMW3_9MICO|nr:mechanosensitive ion channel family protein [Microbacterium jejuense]MBW9093765.1 mechanosensitive ion channel family protein [Microbacterium jejuense]